MDHWTSNASTLPKARRYPSTAPATAPRSLSLCSFCSSELILDDSLIGLTVEVSSDDQPRLCFSALESPRMSTSLRRMPNSLEIREVWKAGIDYKRLLTLPELPELSPPLRGPGCQFCLALQKALIRRYGGEPWWHVSKKSLEMRATYEWLRFKNPDEMWKSSHGLPSSDWSLHSLVVDLEHPNISRDWDVMHRIMDNEIIFGIKTVRGPVQDSLGMGWIPIDPGGPKSDSSLHLIKDWLGHCSASPHCERWRAEADAHHENFLPRRLIYLGGTGEAETAQIIETQDLNDEALIPYADRRLKYACLSYCWGPNGVPLQTTSETLTRHKQGLPEDLPLVFSDAIFVSRKLGIQYLWIDALCIVQGDDDDWERESGRMAEIFRHSYLTIGAARSSSCDESFLGPREGDNHLRLGFRSTICPEISGTYNIRLVNEYSDPRRGGSLEADLGTSNWNTRGWVWQEQSLAPRLLIFGEKMTHLRCHETLYSEDGTSDFQPEGPCSVHHMFKRYNLGPAWRRWIVVEFVPRKLTFARDKLAAVAGIARFAQEAIGRLRDGEVPTYLAGHWLQGDFYKSLQWVIRQPQLSYLQMKGKLHTCDSYCAPSWSWASRDEGELASLPESLDKAVEVPFDFKLNNIKAAGSDPRIRAAPGSSIAVRGNLLPVPVAPSRATFVPHPGTRSYRISHDVGKTRFRRWEATVRGGLVQYFLDWDPRLDQAASRAVESHLQLFLTARSNPTEKSVFATGLILMPEEQDVAGFIRVGAFYFAGPRSLSDKGRLPGTDFLEHGWGEQDIVLF